MADFSVSLHEDDSFNLDHDNRVYCSANISPEKSGENISYEGNISLRDFYEKTFQKAYEEYIQKTKIKHPERVRDLPPKYYDFIAQKQAEGAAKYEKAKRDGAHGSELAKLDSYTKVAKQIIIQVGNTDDLEAMGPEEREKTRNAMRDILKEYMDTFQAENPNLRIINAVIHMDEISLSPHLHITYVGVKESSRGQQISNSQSGALKAMGFESDKKADENGGFQTGQMKWQTKERERVIEIASRHGLSVGYQKGNRGTGLTIEDYRAAKQAEREAMMEQDAIDARKAELEQVRSDIDNARDAHVQMSEDLYNITDEVGNAMIDLEDTQDKVAEAKTTLKQTEEQIQVKHSELDNLTEQVNELPSVINRSVDKCERDLEEKLIPPVPPSDTYERVTKGSFGKKQKFVMVPEKDYEVLERRNGLKPQVVKDIIRETLQPLRNAITKLPVVRNLLDAIQRLEQEVSEWKKRFRKSEKEKEVLQKEVHELKAEKAVADRVMQTKLHLSPQVIDKMKAEAARELAQEQEINDVVLGH